MIKKFGAVTVGVAAGLVAAAPFASATESHGDHHATHGSDSSSCNVTGGSAEANGGISGDSLLGNVLTQAPVGGNNVGNVVCNDILNGNLSGNSATIDVGGTTLPTSPVENGDPTPGGTESTPPGGTEGTTSGGTEGTTSGGTGGTTSDGTGGTADPGTLMQSMGL